MRLLRDALLAIFAGLLLTAAFPNLDVWFLAPLAVAIITWVQWRSTGGRSFLMGVLFGLTFFLSLMPWLRVIGSDAWIAASVFCAIWVGLLGWATARLTRLPWAPIWVGFAWVAMEAIRENLPVLGFTWGRLAFSQSTSPLGGFAAWGGAVGVTFLVAVAGALLAQASRADTWPSTFAPAATAVALVILAGVIPGPTLPTTGSLQVALIQGGTPQTGLGDRDVRREVLANHASVTTDLGRDIGAGVATRPDLVLWPENSVDFDPFQDLEAARTIQGAADAVGTPILVGAVMDDPDDPTLRANVAILWEPDSGPQQIYVKQRLVPFGEFIPLRSLIASRVDRLDRVRRDFAPGDEPGLFPVSGAVIGNVICFEVAYDAAISEVVRGGADILTVQTNNATWAGMNQINQQLAIERLRARETGRSLGVAATTGATVAFDPRGREIASVPIDDVGYVVADLPRVSAQTPGSILGPPFTVAAIVLTVLGLVLTWTPIARRALTRVEG